LDKKLTTFNEKRDRLRKKEISQKEIRNVKSDI
jgi:hypothetical protein